MAVNKLVGARIGIFGKGGAGKSTLAAMLAQALQHQGYKICVIDGDSTNFGLPSALGLDPPEQSLLEYYGGTVFSGGKVTCPVDDPTPLLGSVMRLEELPRACYAQKEDRLVLLTAGKMGGLGAGAGCDGPVAKIARDFDLTNDNGKYLTLIDFKAGFEDSARGGLTRLDYVIVVIDPTSASIQIASDMLQMVEQIQGGALPATAHLESPDLVAVANEYYQKAAIKEILFILNKIPDKETETIMRLELEKNGIQPVAVLPSDSAIRTAWLRGDRIRIGAAEKGLSEVISALEA